MATLSVNVDRNTPMLLPPDLRRTDPGDFEPTRYRKVEDYTDSVVAITSVRRLSWF